MKNIYLCAKAGAGKSSCAEYLTKKGYQQSSFAYPVYNLAYDYFNMDKKLKDRKLLQVIGTDAGRYYDKDIWVDRFVFDIMIVEKTRELLDLQKTLFVCPDCRFINEHKALRRAGWLGIYLDVSDDIRIKRLNQRDATAQIETLNHASETALDEFKHELVSIDASGSIEEMCDNLEVALNTPFIIKQLDDDWNYRNQLK